MSSDSEPQAQRGNRLFRQGRFADAEACYRAALAAEPGRADLLVNLGTALFCQGQFDAAASFLRDAVARDPGNAQGHTNLAETLRALGDTAGAIAAYRRSLVLDPARAITHNNLGTALMDLARPDEAAACFRAALLRDPAHREARYNLAIALLLLGEMPEAWRHYEARWELGLLAAPQRGFTEPRWQGEAAPGRTLLIHAEQGLGDTLQFCRYAPLAAARGFRVILQVQPPLLRLLHGLRGVAAVVPTRSAPPAFDLHCAMLSLPLAFGTTVATIPAAMPYLFADTAEAARWARRLAATGSTRPRIGLAWAGKPSPNHASATAMDRRRSIAPDLLAPLFAVAGIDLFSLQKDGPPVPAGAALIDRMAEMRDFADTAALVANLDLVVTVDTAVAHLAGALGRPVWLLNRFDSCWRWLLQRRDSPWYPTLRQYRQPAPGAWGAVIEEVAADLCALAAAWPGRLLTP